MSMSTEEQTLELYEQLTTTSSQIRCTTQKHPHNSEQISLRTAISTLPSAQLSRMFDSPISYSLFTNLPHRLEFNLFIGRTALLKRQDQYNFLLWFRAIFDRVDRMKFITVWIVLMILQDVSHLISPNYEVLSSYMHWYQHILYKLDFYQDMCHPLQIFLTETIYANHPSLYHSLNGHLFAFITTTIHSKSSISVTAIIALDNLSYSKVAGINKAFRWNKIHMFTNRCVFSLQMWTMTNISEMEGPYERSVKLQEQACTGKTKRDIQGESFINSFKERILGLQKSNDKLKQRHHSHYAKQVEQM